MTKILVLIHSMYGHIEKMAEAVADGAKKAGAKVDIKQVPETLPMEVLEKMGAKVSKLPIASKEELSEYDGIIVGTPTRFGNMSGQMRAFWDATGGLWSQNSLVGKIGSVFTSSATQHGGQETTIISTHLTMLHHGMIIAGLPYSEARQRTMEEISGGSPYGASTIAGADGSRTPSENELEMAKTQGRIVAEIAKKLAN